MTILDKQLDSQNKTYFKGYNTGVAFICFKELEKLISDDRSQKTIAFFWMMNQLE